MQLLLCMVEACAPNDFLSHETFVIQTNQAAQPHSETLYIETRVVILSGQSEIKMLIRPSICACYVCIGFNQVFS